MREQKQNHIFYVSKLQVWPQH